MKRMILLLCFVVGLCAQSRINWTGALDTNLISNFYSDTLLFSKPFPITNGEHSTGFVMADDTSSDGAASDSIKFEVMYQVGRLIKTSSVRNVWDTVWSNFIVQDTFSLDSIYSPDDPALADRWITDRETGIITSTGSAVDTSSYADTLSRWVYQEYAWSPPWRLYLRFAFRGLAGNKVGSFVKLMCGITQRDHQEAR